MEWISCGQCETLFSVIQESTIRYSDAHGPIRSTEVFVPDLHEAQSVEILSIVSLIIYR
jgi:hypothetical protein